MVYQRVGFFKKHKVQTREIYLYMCYLLCFEEKKPCPGSINYTDSSTCCLELFIIHSSSVRVHVEHQMGQNGYIILDESNASISFPDLLNIVWYVGAGSSEPFGRIVCSSQRRLTNILLSGDHQSLMYHKTDCPKRFVV